MRTGKRGKARNDDKVVNRVNYCQKTNNTNFGICVKIILKFKIPYLVAERLYYY